MDRATPASFREAQLAIFEGIAQDAPLSTTLAAIVLAIEAECSGMACSILRFDRRDRTLHTGAAPSLPAVYSAAIDGTPAGPCSGSCGTAAWRGEEVVVTDLGTDPLWADFKHLALPHGLRACWSTPIMSPSRQVLGTFAMYFFAARGPSDGERTLVSEATHLASIALSRAEASAALHASQEALGRSESELRAIFENAAIGMVLVAPGGVPTRVNPCFERFLGYRADELATMRFSDYTHPADREQDQALYHALLEDPTRDAYEHEKRYLRRDGTVVWGRLKVTRLDDLSRPLAERFVIAMVEDITAKKSLEHQVLRAQRMDTLARLASGIAHDMNNIMTAIHGYASLAQITVPAESDAGHALHEIDRASTRATDLVRRILAFSRDTEPQRVVGDLAPVVSEAFGLLRPLIPSRIEARLTLDPDRVAARADPTQIHQIVMNLATNALHAMPGPGVLHLRLGPRHLDSPPDSGIAIGPEPTPGDWVVLEVQDTGVGIDPAVLDRIFEPFFTTRSAGQGTGLGLAMVLAITKNHEGAVRVTSAPGVGSTFSVWLPAALPSQRAARPPSPTPDLLRARDEPIATPTSPPAWGSTGPHRGGGPGADQAQGAHVLFVDDEHVIARLATRELEREGYRVSAFTDPKAALHALRATPEAFDALVSDASMPELSGYELIAAARSLRPELPTLLITGGPLNNELALRGPPPWDALLLKPAALRQLGETLARLLTQRR